MFFFSPPPPPPPRILSRYLIPGHHVMPNQLAIIGSPDLYAQAARKFLQLLPTSCVAAENMLLESIKRSLSPPPSLPRSQEVSKALTTHPPTITSSPLSNLDRPNPIRPTSPPTNVHALPSPPAASTNPFDDTVIVPASSRSRTNSDASTSSLVSMSSASSASQSTGHPGNGLEPAHSKLANSAIVSDPPSSSSSSSFRFDVTSPEMAYIYNLSVVRRAIKDCYKKCQCWSSIYDKCIYSKETILEENRKMKKSLEMEDLASIKIQVTAEESCSVGASSKEEGSNEISSFRSRATTLSGSSRPSKRSGNNNRHDQLHSSRGVVAPEEEEESKMVAGISPSSSSIQSHGGGNLSPHSSPRGLRRAGTISGGSRTHTRAGSPRLSSRHEMRISSPSSQFEDKIGLFLKIVMEKMMGMMQHPPTVNILLTRLVSRLAYYPHPLLRSLLLNHQLVLKPGIPNLFSVSLHTCNN